MTAPARHFMSLGASVKLAVTMADSAGNPLAFSSGPTLSIGDPTVLSSVDNHDNSFTVTVIGTGLSDVSITGSAVLNGVTYTKVWGPVAVECVNNRPGNTGINVAVSSIAL